MAGKAEDVEFIRQHHASLLTEYKAYLDHLGAVLEQKTKEDAASEDRPMADYDLMESVYEALYDAVGRMDSDIIEATFAEMDAYAIPEEESELFAALKEKANRFDYDGMKALLEAKGK